MSKEQFSFQTDPVLRVRQTLEKSDPFLLLRNPMTGEVLLITKKKSVDKNSLDFMEYGRKWR
jgi:hypothetical protein